MLQSAQQKSIFWGVVAGLAMAGFYLAVMFLTMKSAYVVWDTFVQFWYLIVGIIIGFGVQIGLWVCVKSYSRHEGPGAVAGVSGATSGTAMLACCAHHLADVLPILGLVGAGAWLTQYQGPILVLGLSINFIGIAYMLNVINKHKLMKC